MAALGWLLNLGFGGSGATAEAVEVAEVFSGGFWSDIDRIIDENRRLIKERKRKRRRVKKLEDELDRQLFIAERRIEEGDSRETELARLTRIVEANRKIIVQTNNQELIHSMNVAINQATFSAMERLERQLTEYREEEDFIMQAAKILLEQ